MGQQAHPSLRDHRDDIQGIRVIGALLVFSFHVFFSGVSGGVDVFFVVSGYFMAKNAVKRGELEKPMPLLSFYRNFLLRVAPQAIVALSGILVLLFLFTSPMVWSTNLRDIMASALYLENWRLISRGQDYLARSEALTLVQHFWAVSLIGQTYFVWPFILRLAKLVRPLTNSAPGAVLGMLVAALSAASLCWSLYFTLTTPASAYFDFFSRFWEFGCGVLLGLQGAVRTNAGRGLAALLSWLGLSLLVSCGFVIGTELAFPGYASLWPVAAAALLIRYGRASDRANAGWALARPGLARLGEVSFGVYLWHWPLFVIYESMGDTSAVTLPAGLTLLALSVGLAMLSKRLVDWLFSRERISSSTKLAPLACLALLMMISVSSEYARREIVAMGRSWDRDSARLPGFIAPGPFSVRSDNPSVYKSGCHQTGASVEARTCSFGRPDAGKTIVLVGGSHSVQWLPALTMHAEKENWRVISMTKSGCLFADPADKALFRTLPPSCASWNNAALEEIKAIQPDLVVTLATRRSETGTSRTEYIPDGYVSRFKQLGASGIRVLALRDNPWMPKDVPVCVYSPIVDDKNTCGELRSTVLDDAAFAHSRAKIPAGVHLSDLTEHFCDTRRCWAVKDGIVIYRDSNHITATYAARISPALRDAISGVL